MTVLLVILTLHLAVSAVFVLARSKINGFWDAIATIPILFNYVLIAVLMWKGGQ